MEAVSFLCIFIFYHRWKPTYSLKIAGCRDEHSFKNDPFSGDIRSFLEGYNYMVSEKKQEKLQLKFMTKVHLFMLHIAA